MTRTMYDSTNAWDIPRNAQMVAGYDDGAFAWALTDWDLFPNAVHVHISTQPGNDTSPVMDVERGDWQPWQVPDGCRERRARGIVPTGYSTQSDWFSIVDACRQQEVTPPLWWEANYDGVPIIPAGAIAKQYANPPQSGGHYDLSIVADYWPGIDPPPPAGYTVEPRGDTMQLFAVSFTTDGNGNGCLELDGQGGRPLVPWAKYVAISHRGGFPPVDGYWPGEVGVQDRDNNVLLQFTRGLPSHPEVVFVTALD